MALRHSLVGHQKQTQRIWQVLDKKQLATSWIFSGPQGVGKKLLALAVAQELNCSERLKTKGACGRCPSCIQIEKGQHENLFYVKSENLQIKVEACRDILRFISLRPRYGHKVILVDGIEFMTFQGVNALLKTIEEPPEQVYFFFITEVPSHLLPTLRSRCQFLSFQGLTFEDLKKLFPEEPSWMLRASRGSLGVLGDLKTEGRISFRQKSFELWSLPFKDKPSVDKLTDFVKMDVSSKEELFFLTKCWQEWIRDAWVCQSSQKDKVLHQDLISGVEKISHLVPSSFLSFWSERVFELEKGFSQNLDKVLSFENYFYELRGAYEYLD